MVFCCISSVISLCLCVIDNVTSMLCTKGVNNGLYGFCIFVKTDAAAILTDAFWLSIWLNLKFIYIFTFYWLIKFIVMYLSGSAHSKPEEDNIFARAQQHIAMQVRHILLASVFLLVFHSLLLNYLHPSTNRK